MERQRMWSEDAAGNLILNPGFVAMIEQEDARLRAFLIGRGAPEGTRVRLVWRLDGMIEEGAFTVGGGMLSFNGMPFEAMDNSYTVEPLAA